MQMTSWFKGVEPVRKGVYQRRYEFGIYFAHFDGADWGLACDTVEEAQNWEPYILSTYSGLSWRGLISRGGA